MLGSLALAVSAITLFGQLERTANRVYGIERDRPTVQKYARAAVMALTAGTLVVVYVMLVSVGGGLGSPRPTGRTRHRPCGPRPMAARLRRADRRAGHHPAPRSSTTAARVGLVADRALVSAGLTLAATALLHLYLQGSGNVGETYGPLAGVLGLLLWSYACALSLVAGTALSAQLEAIRSGRADPRSDDKTNDGEADGVTVGYGAATRGAPS